MRKQGKSISNLVIGETDEKKVRQIIHSANSFLQKHTGMNCREFYRMYGKGNSIKNYIGENPLVGLAHLEELEGKGYNINEIPSGKLKDFYYLLQNSFLNPKIEYTLSQNPKARDKRQGLTTLVSERMYNKMLQGDIDKKILVGKKYYDKKSDINFDILLDMKNFGEISKLDSRETPIVPYLNEVNVVTPQDNFLSLNSRFPSIDKVFLGGEGKNPFLFRLIETRFKKKMFVPGSYLTLEKMH